MVLAARQCVLPDRHTQIQTVFSSWRPTYASNPTPEPIRSFPHPLLSVLQHADRTAGLDRNQQRIEKGTNGPRCATVRASGSAYMEQDVVSSLTPRLCQLLNPSPPAPPPNASNRIAEHIRSFPHPLLSVLQHVDLTPGLDRNQQRIKKGTNGPRCATVRASASTYADPDGILQLSPDLYKQPHTRTHSFLSTSVVVRPAARGSHPRAGPQPTANRERNEWSSLRDSACFRIGLCGTRCCFLPHTPPMPASQSVPTCPATYASNRIAEHIRSFPHSLLSVLRHKEIESKYHLPSRHGPGQCAESSA
jgi:hypothetical protein